MFNIQGKNYKFLLWGIVAVLFLMALFLSGKNRSMFDGALLMLVSISLLGCLIISIGKMSSKKKRESTSFKKIDDLSIIIFFVIFVMFLIDIFIRW